MVYMEYDVYYQFVYCLFNASLCIRFDVITVQIVNLANSIYVLIIY